jgi:hypothetical protein
LPANLRPGNCHLPSFEPKLDARERTTRQEFAEVRSWFFSGADDGVFPSERSAMVGRETCKVEPSATNEFDDPSGRLDHAIVGMPVFWLSHFDTRESLPVAGV